MIFYIDTQKSDSTDKIANALKKCISAHCTRWSEIVFLCIGTDRMTGDCLGPYIGEQLCQNPPWNSHVYGTIFSPVHALNLSKITKKIQRNHPLALTIAIDAALGNPEDIGYVSIGSGALLPGSGVQKNLPPVGDIHITGIVNMSGFLEQFTLQTTRLSTIITMGNKITQGIQKCTPCVKINTISN